MRWIHLGCTDNLYVGVKDREVGRAPDAFPAGECVRARYSSSRRLARLLKGGKVYDAAAGGSSGRRSGEEEPGSLSCPESAFLGRKAPRTTIKKLDTAQGAVPNVVTAG